MPSRSQRAYRSHTNGEKCRTIQLKRLLHLEKIHGIETNRTERRKKLPTKNHKWINANRKYPIIFGHCIFVTIFLRLLPIWIAVMSGRVPFVSFSQIRRNRSSNSLVQWYQCAQWICLNSESISATDDPLRTHYHYTGHKDQPMIILHFCMPFARALFWSLHRRYSYLMQFFSLFCSLNCVLFSFELRGFASNY